MRASAAGSPPTSAIGTCSTAPAAALATVGVTCTARWRGSTTPSTPAPSQQRSIAPRLPGSVTPSTATRNGARPGRRLISVGEVGLGQRRGEGDHALRRLAARLRPRAACGRRPAPATRSLRAISTMSATMSLRLAVEQVGRDPDLAAPCACRRSAARARPGGPRPARRRASSPACAAPRRCGVMRPVRPAPRDAN